MLGLSVELCIWLIAVPGHAYYQVSEVKPLVRKSTEGVVKSMYRWRAQWQRWSDEEYPRR